uniref:SHSP domain-containing protein n=1 Tax=Strigamia maritima TaxID=126957 RepID=T1ITY9_STRMM
MSLLPLLMYPVSRWESPSRIFSQNFGFGEDLYPVPTTRCLYLRPRQDFIRQESGLSEIIDNDEKFQASVQVGSFKPDELSVKTVDNTIVIHGKHEVKDDDGFVSREFTRRYVLPVDSKPEEVTCEMIDDRLVITAPKRPKEIEPGQERNVPITSKL